MSLFLGLMSGTSMDGVDAVLVDWPADDSPSMKVRAHLHREFEAGLRRDLLALNQTGANELHRCAKAANALARCYAGSVQALLQQAGSAAEHVLAIGAHGQTVRHRPDERPDGYTVQLLNAALLAELCGIHVVCDFRSRDIAAGGQGAPLVPAFHAARFAAAGLAQAVVNLGGIANLTLLSADAAITGFDSGPGNVLLDLWIDRHRGAKFDAGGHWAASGRVIPALLQRMRAEPYFDRAPPKSTGRDLFNAAWLDGMLAAEGGNPDPADVQATLAELTAQSIVDALRRHRPDAQRLTLCGGGALNTHLRSRLSAMLVGTQVQITTDVGLPVDQVEAVAFAWLARAFVLRQAGNCIVVTGAAGPRVLGALYPAW